VPFLAHKSCPGLEGYSTIRRSCKRSAPKEGSTMLIKAVTFVSNLVIPLMIATICVAGYIKKVKIYETFIEAQKKALPLQ